MCLSSPETNPLTQLTVFNFRLFGVIKKIMACNYNESLGEEILDMIFDDEDDEEQFNGFTRLSGAINGLKPY